MNNLKRKRSYDRRNMNNVGRNINNERRNLLESY